jgi:hypothetical protein
VPLTVEQINSYREDGFLTLESIFPLATIAELKADSEIWAAFFLSQLSPEERQWYVEGDDAKIIRLRKLDNPHIHRPLFAALIQSAEILEMLTSLLKGNPICFFSQLFFKPPEGGGPKPTHQDNFYFRPQDQEDIITV